MSGDFEEQAEESRPGFVGHSALVDTRLVNKPGKFDGAQSSPQRWVQFRFVFESYMSCVDVDYDPEMETAIMHDATWDGARLMRSTTL